MARFHRSVGALLPLLVSSGLGCGRTELALTAANGTIEKPASLPTADAASSPELALPVGPDLAPQPGPDLAPPLGPDLEPDLRNPNCGNGRLDPREECDDGNASSGDGCDSSCRVECSFTPCPWPPLTAPVICGDGRLGSAETCDDGNTDRGDGCSDVCQVELGFYCVVPGRRCTPLCGDGRVLGTETCDDGNQMSGDGCSEFCLTEDCWDCTGGVCRPRPPAVDGGNCRGLPTAWCGDGKLQGAEECDNGAGNSDGDYAGCSTRCRYLGCGDGIVNGPEECDLGHGKNTTAYGDPAGCRPGCTLAHYCGDGYVDSDHGEQCDYGALNGASICGQYCHIYLP
jgi:cysteine-rich repeat protein